MQQHRGANAAFSTAMRRFDGRSRSGLQSVRLLRHEYGQHQNAHFQYEQSQRLRRPGQYTAGSPHRYVPSQESISRYYTHDEPRFIDRNIYEVKVADFIQRNGGRDTFIKLALEDICMDKEFLRLVQNKVLKPNQERLQMKTNRTSRTSWAAVC